MSKKKNLTLSIKQVYFDEILAGTKKIETREIRPNNRHRYCQVDEKGRELIDKETNEILPVEYDTITFLTGAYKGTRPRMVVKVERADIFLLVDEETGELIILQDEKGKDYYAAIIEYSLGEIISRP